MLRGVYPVLDTGIQLDGAIPPILPIVNKLKVKSMPLTLTGIKISISLMAISFQLSVLPHWIPFPYPVRDKLTTEWLDR